MRLNQNWRILGFVGSMIKSTILEDFEEPLYVVVVWYTGKVLHIVPVSIIANQLNLWYICSDNPSFFGEDLQNGCNADL